MRFKQGLLALLGAAAVAFGASADPSVTINSVRQNYPWNNTVEINYTIANTPSGADWYISFSAVAGGSTYKLSPSDLDLTDDPISNGTYTAKWTAPDGISEDSATVTVTLTEGGDDYMIVDLTTGGVTYEKMKSQTASNTKYNTDEYKTTKMVFRKVPAGDHQCSTSAKLGVPKDYYIGIFPLTKKQFHILGGKYGDNGGTASTDPSSAEAPKIADNICWNIANTVAGTLSTKVRTQGGVAYTFQIPTEAMWEIATRAETTTTYPWGNSWDSTKGTFSRNGVAGSFAPNAWGIYDTNGSVIEWCQDWWGGAYPPANALTLTASSGSNRVLRSGYDNCGMTADSCTSAYRGIGNPTYGYCYYSYYGFRLARIVQ